MESYEPNIVMSAKSLIHRSSKNLPKSRKSVARPSEEEDVLLSRVVFIHFLTVYGLYELLKNVLSSSRPKSSYCFRVDSSLLLTTTETSMMNWWLKNMSFWKILSCNHRV